MARFFLHIRKPDGAALYTSGIELARLGRLHDSVTKIANDLVHDDPAAADWSFEVHDETGRNVLSDKLGKFSAVVKPAT
jgi:hypothetical protein